MKTTLELPDDLMIQAKATAAQRRTTLKAMFENALRREIDYKLPHAGKSEIFTTNEYGFPVIKRQGKAVITNAMIYKIMEEEDI
jgi:hypothetical protein